MALQAVSADSKGRDACSSRQQGTLVSEARVQQVRGSSSGVAFILKPLHVREGGAETAIVNDMAFGIRLDPLRTPLMLVLEVSYFGNSLLSRDFTRIACRSSQSPFLHFAEGIPLVSWSFKFRYIYHFISCQKAKL